MKDEVKKPKGQASGAQEAGKEKSVGDTLRRVYRQTIDEQIPDEMLDLLNKLD